MNVKELKEALEGLPDDMTVVHQSDPEGNAFRRLAGADPNGIIIEDGYALEVYDTTWSASDACLDEEEWEREKTEKEKCVVLWPV